MPSLGDASEKKTQPKKSQKKGLDLGDSDEDDKNLFAPKKKVAASAVSATTAKPKKGLDLGESDEDDKNLF